MKKLKREREIPVVVKNESLKDFFARGKEIAKRLTKKNGFYRLKQLVLRIFMI